MRTHKVFLLVSFLLCAGCGQGGCSRSQPAGDADKSKPAFAGATFARQLPRRTLVYVRLQGARDLKDRLVQPAHLRNAAVVQEKLNQTYQALLGMVGKDNPFGFQEATVKKLLGDLESIHLAMLPGPAVSQAGGADPGVSHGQEPLIFLQMANSDSVDLVLKELGAKAQAKELGGNKVFSLQGMKGIPQKTILHVLDGKVMVVGSEAVLEQFLAGKNAAENDSLAAAQAFQKAHRELGEKGDLFVYASITELRAEMLREVDSQSNAPADGKERRKKEITNAPFQEIGSVAGSLAVDGSLVIRAYTAPGKQLPDFIVRSAARKKLLGRIPADALFAYVVGYDGGKKTRKDFSKWLTSEMARGGSGQVLGIPAPVAALAKNLDRLESDVVVIAKEFWLAALPVKKELALCIAPDSAGRWGLAMFFDYEDKRQAEKLKREIFEVANRHHLPWEEEKYQGTTIRYLDLQKLAGRNGAKGLPPEVVDQVQLKVGYAMSDELLLAGTVDTIKFALNPSGKTLADVISYRAIDAENALLYTFQPGKFLHQPSRIKALEKIGPLLARQIAPEASYSVTVTLEKEQATVRCNIPFTSLAAWIALDFQDWMRMLR